MTNNKLGKLGNSGIAANNKTGTYSENFRRYTTAKWILATQTQKEIKEKWLKSWPYLSPYMRLILISHNAKQSYSVKQNTDFLYYWKQAIQLTGFDICPVKKSKIQSAVDKYELPLKGIDELTNLIGKKSNRDRKLICLMVSIFNPNWGEQVSFEFNINISKTAELDNQYHEIYTGLLCTYNGF